MTSQYQAGWLPDYPGGVYPDATSDPSTLIRTHRMTRVGGARRRPDGSESSLWRRAIFTLDGRMTRLGEIPFDLALLVPIDVHRLDPDRSDVELGWIRERLDPTVVLVLIWPGLGSLAPQRQCSFGSIEHLVDATGEFGRRVRSTADALGLLFDPRTRSVESVSPEHPVFAVGHRADGTDRTLDLGDLRY